jgi:flagellar basal-body rod protein FlgB
MEANRTDIFALAESRMAWAGQRQAVLAQNIANANTPGYAARDVTPFKDVLAAQERAAAGLSPAGAWPGGTADRTASESSLDGNAVVLDEQLEKVAETDGAHQLAMTLYRKYSGMFRTAIGHT